MSNQHYPVEDCEVEVTLKVKVKLSGMSQYTYLNKTGEEDTKEEFKAEIGKWLEAHICDSYQEEVVEYTFFQFNVSQFAEAE